MSKPYSEMTDEKIEELALEYFKKECPHLKNDEYFHSPDKSMTMRSVIYGAQEVRTHYEKQSPYKIAVQQQERYLDALETIKRLEGALRKIKISSHISREGCNMIAREALEPAPITKGTGGKDAN